MSMAMAEEDSDTSVAASSSTGNWWNTVSSEGPSLCSWNEGNLNTWPSDSPNVTHNSGCEDNLSTSFTNTSNNSAITMDSTELQGRQDLVESHASLLGHHTAVQIEPSGGVPDSHIWSQVLLGTVNCSNEGVQSVQSSVGNLYEVLSSRALRTELLEPCDHLKKMEDEDDQVPTCWEFTSLTPFQAADHDLSLSNVENKIPCLHYNGHLVDDRPNDNNYAISDLGSWSIAPPDQDQPCHAGLCRSMPVNSFNSGLDYPFNNSHFHELGRIKQECPMSYTSAHVGGGINPNNHVFQGFGSDGYKNNEGHPHILEATNKSFLKSINGGCNHNMGSFIAGEDNIYPSRWQSSSTITFGSSFNKSMLDFHASKPLLRHQSQNSQHRAMGNEARDSNNDIKKRSTESTSHDTIFKRPRLESTPSLSSFKVQAPKVKLGDRITALQQLVSPFGKTDTASVLLEAIGYIKYLQDQVQVLSTPYMKTGGGQGDHKCWGGSDQKKDSKEPKQDLKSRGLCLVPLSCTLHVSIDNSSDYWTPSVGGSCYR
eukprot:Gb_40387 [translate_table: standard]